LNVVELWPRCFYFWFSFLQLWDRHCLYVTWCQHGLCSCASLNWFLRIFSSLNLFASIISKEMRVRVEAVQNYVMWKWANYGNLPKKIELSLFEIPLRIFRVRTIGSNTKSSSTKLLVRRWQIHRCSELPGLFNLLLQSLLSRSDSKD